MFEDGYGQLGTLGALGGGARRPDTRNMGLDALVGGGSIRAGNVGNSLANKLLMDWLNAEADYDPNKGQKSPQQQEPQDTGYVERRLAEMLAKGMF